LQLQRRFYETAPICSLRQIVQHNKSLNRRKVKVKVKVATAVEFNTTNPLTDKREMCCWRQACTKNPTHAPHLTQINEHYTEQAKRTRTPRSGLFLHLMTHADANSARVSLALAHEQSTDPSACGSEKSKMLSAHVLACRA
jgi:hypothetical protein